MKTTRYFDEQVRRKRLYLTPELCAAALAAPLHTETQPDGRIRIWSEIVLPDETAPRVLRLVLL